jgi:hypothetical protein
VSLSNDLKGTADFLAGWALHKKPIPYHTAGLLAEKLLALADQVQHLEVVPLRLDSPEVRLGFHLLRRRENHDAE